MRCLGAALGLLLGILAGAVGAFEEASGELVASEACEALVGFRQRGNPDGRRLVPGERYRVLGRNRPDGPWLQVLVPDAEPRQRWVEARCGTLAVAPRAAGLRPFFDEVDEGPADPAPPPPPRTALDRAVLEVCGPWGSRPRRDAFRAMLDRPDLAPELRRVLAALGGRADARRLKDELTDAWFAVGGFAHVFCGEPRPDELDGLHYRGRYLELQEQGLAGLMGPRECRAAEIEPPVYTVGVRYRLPGGGPLRTDCPKGYAYDLGAADLLIAATAAWRDHRTAGGGEMCLIELDGYHAVLVTRGDAIRTFYPDLSPRCDDGGRPVRCACGG